MAAAPLLIINRLNSRGPTALIVFLFALTLCQMKVMLTTIYLLNIK